MGYSSFQSPSSSSVGRISPFIMLVIIILAVVFFIYGLVHLVLWFLMKRPSSSAIFQSNRSPEATRSRTLQRQLQQLFRMHDSGLDQALIDSLPVFFYKDVLGLKEPFDCAVCLCEFLDEDKLRLLPVCSHAFHINCIDTWLLSNSTCPLCRAILASSGFPIQNQFFDFENSRVLSNRITDDEENACSDIRRPETVEEDIGEKRVVSVKLGKFKNNGTTMSGENVQETSRCNLDARRCYSMGSYQYVVGDSNLQVILSEKRGGEASELRRAYLCDTGEDGDEIGKRIIGGRRRGESFSVSKIWLWSNRSHFHTSNAAFP